MRERRPRGSSSSVLQAKRRPAIRSMNDAVPAILPPPSRSKIDDEPLPVLTGRLWSAADAFRAALRLLDRWTPAHSTWFFMAAAAALLIACLLRGHP